MRFRGITKLNVDAKGRVAMPKHYRELLLSEGSGDLVVTVDSAGCLLVYPLGHWEEVETQLDELPNGAGYGREMQRLLIGFATDVQLDGSGRFLVNPELREEAKIERKVVLIGQGKKFELWDEAAWNEAKEQAKRVLRGEEAARTPLDARPVETPSINL